MSKLLKILQKIVSFLHISAAKATPVASKLSVFTGSGDDSTLVHNLGSHPGTSSRHSQIENSVFIHLCPQLFVLAAAPRILRPDTAKSKIPFSFVFVLDFSYFGYALDTPSRHSQIKNSVFIHLCPRLIVLAAAP